MSAGHAMRRGRSAKTAKIHIARRFNEQGVNRADRLQIISTLVGRPITSLNECSYEELIHVEDIVRRTRIGDQPS